MKNLIHRALKFILAMAITMVAGVAAEPKAPTKVVQVSPRNDATGVKVRTTIALHFSDGLKLTTIKPEAIRLLDEAGRTVEARLGSDIEADVVNVQPNERLKAVTTYRVEVNQKLLDRQGLTVAPFSSTFTTSVDSGPLPNPEGFQFTKTKVDDEKGPTAIAVGPDGNVYVATYYGIVYRLLIDPQTGLARGKEKLLTLPGERKILGLAFDPEATATNAVAWITYDDRTAERLDVGTFSGCVSRLVLPPAGAGAKAQETQYIIGLPSGWHPLNGCSFGPDKRLYISVGSMNRLGHDPARPETLLSAAVVVVAVRNPNFNVGQLPLNVQTSAPVNYDPYANGAPLAIYATGFREMYRLCWHSNGNLYGGVNQNDGTGRAETPSKPGVPTLTAVFPDEDLVRIVPGGYYGHPNPSRNEFVLLGGNPTAGIDPWEVAEYPVGVQPERHFDPANLIFNLKSINGTSADGCAEYTAAGPLQGRLLVCFFEGEHSLHTFAFDESGKTVTNQRSLVDEQNERLRFTQPIDVAAHPSGRIYVADFGEWGSFGGGGMVWGLNAFPEIPKPVDAPKPKSPEESASAFKLPEGFRMEVVASEPLIASPSAVCWDERGRMFVSELHGYNLAGQLDIEELNKTGKLDTEVRRVQADEKFKRAAEGGTFGVVKLLRDNNGDGRMDASEVWATNLPPVYGLVPARGGVIVACAPDIVFLADRDGDGKAETRDVLFTGFPTGELERGINAPQWGLDGWIYFGRGWGGGEIRGARLRGAVNLPGSDFRIRADGSAIEPVTGATHTFGFAMNLSGDRFTVTTTVPGIFIAPLPWHYLARNPDAATPGLESPTGDRRAYSISKPHPWRQKRADDPAYFKYYNSRYGAAESEADGWFTSACGPMIYEDRVLPGLHGQYFVCEPAGNLIHCAVIEADGPTLKLRRAGGEEKSEFAASSDAWSHPMNLAHGPDGSIWVVDYYREIIEDYSAIPRHLQQQYGVYAGHDRGRIYRLTHRDAPRGADANMAGLETAGLVRECGSPLFWRRQTASRLLVERGEKKAASELRELLQKKNAEAAALITALRTLDQLGALARSDARGLLAHSDVEVRVHALQLAERWFDQADVLDAALTAAAKETNPRVLIQFALSLGEARDPRAFAMLIRLAREGLDIRWMDAAILSSIHGREVEMLEAIEKDPGVSSEFLAALRKCVASRGSNSKVATVADDEATPLPVVEAVSDETVRGFVAALAGARNLKRGHELFNQACATCHRMGIEGKDVGPDLMGQLGMAEESLVKELLLPSERIRPGFETTIVQLKDGSSVAGILQNDGATSLTIVQGGGVEQTVLRKDVAGVRRVGASLMPSFAKTLKPSELADLLAWLRSNLREAGQTAIPP